MRLRRITLQHFRNITAADLVLTGRQQFFVGANGQGKTNLLEAIGLLTALRSFRTADSRLLIAQGQAEAAVAFELEHERRGDSRVVLKVRAGGKEVWCDGERVTRMGDFLGRFPTVVFSSQDQQLVRGAPGLRRRWLDLTLAAVDPVYLRELQDYHRALAGRNALLKRQASAAEFVAFERPLATAAAAIVAARRENVPVLAMQATEAYAAIAGAAESVGCEYEQSLDAVSAEAWVEAFARQRTRDLAFRTTLAGPHRDDVVFNLSGRLAREFGSEGQQRSLAVALRLAQVDFFRTRAGVQPILLADDVLGELDPDRRRRFWEAVGGERQVIATGTTLPEAELGAWQTFVVDAGRFAAREVGA